MLRSLFTKTNTINKTKGVKVPHNFKTMSKEEYYETLLLCNGFTDEQIEEMSEEEKEMNLGFQ